MQPDSRNTTINLSDIYSAPIGGLVHPEKYTIQDPNTTFESEYKFYSRDWSGEVKYSVFGKYNGQILNGSSILHVEPSTFTAEPNHSYSAKVYLNASSIPKDFFIPQPNWFDSNFGGISISAYIVYVNVSLDGNNSLFCNDNIRLLSFYDKPRPLFNFLDVENSTIFLRKGEIKKFTIIYEPDLYTSPTEISYYFSDTPLNVTFTPTHFIATHNFRFPVVATVSANSNVSSGNYPVNVTLHGDVDYVAISCDKCKIYQEEKTFVVNVTVE
jgi:hypothetical protein